MLGGSFCFIIIALWVNYQISLQKFNEIINIKSSLTLHVHMRSINEIIRGIFFLFHIVRFYNLYIVFTKQGFYINILYSKNIARFLLILHNQKLYKIYLSINVFWYMLILILKNKTEENDFRLNTKKCCLGGMWL